MKNYSSDTYELALTAINRSLFWREIMREHNSTKNIILKSRSLKKELTEDYRIITTSYHFEYIKTFTSPDQYLK